VKVAHALALAAIVMMIEMFIYLVMMIFYLVFILHMIRCSHPLSMIGFKG